MHEEGRVTTREGGGERIKEQRKDGKEEGK